MRSPQLHPSKNEVPQGDKTRERRSIANDPSSFVEIETRPFVARRVDDHDVQTKLDERLKGKQTGQCVIDSLGRCREEMADQQDRCEPTDGEPATTHDGVDKRSTE